MQLLGGLRQLRASRHQRTILFALCAIHAGLLGYSAAIHSPVIDEPAHLAAGLSHWRRGDFSLYQVNPPLVRLVATAPLLLTNVETVWEEGWQELATRGEFSAGESLVQANGSRIFYYTTIARLPCIAFSLAGLLACFAWARLLFGKEGGLCAAALWSFSPFVLGHGSLMTPDAAGAALGVCACYLFARWLASGSWRWALGAGAVLGLAEAAKSTWIILFGLFPLVWLAFRAQLPASATRPKGLQLATILLLAWTILVASYGGKDLGAPLGTIPMKSRLFRRLIGSIEEDGRTRVRPILRQVPLPVPRDYVVGIDRQYFDLEGPNRSFLRGEWRMHGWYYYYAYGLAVKEPLGSLLLVGLAVLFWLGVVLRWKCHRQWSRSRQGHLRAFGLLLVCPTAVFLLASMNTGMNHHVRYVLPVLPFLYIAAAGLTTRCGPWRRPRLALAGGLVLCTAFSSLANFPHSLSYFNEAVGGGTGGLRQLDNSNIDWGQDLLLLAQWKRASAPREAIFLAYNGRVNPVYAGIDYQLLPQFASAGPLPAGEQPPLSPGWYAISATLLQGREYGVQAPWGGRISAPANALVHFQRLKPVDRVGYSIYIYLVESPAAREEGAAGK
ncbi:MAG: glycosyltransferase family 39 protein [Pirellulaceae bacterium]